MSREILFKAKRANWRELPKEDWWVEGNLVWTDDADEDYRAIIIPRENACMFTRSENDDLGFETWYLVDPKTICQYTGLTDKNGRKIFEWDIINDIDYGIMKCIYLHGSFVWYKEDGFKIECMRYVPVVDVIGNIFDNPELLEARQQ